ncbi:MAG: hypothetical protein ACTSUE_09640 [Promethearchaeota archaeon]
MRKGEARIDYSDKGRRREKKFNETQKEEERQREKKKEEEEEGKGTISIETISNRLYWIRTCYVSWENVLGKVRQTIYQVLGTQ